MEAAARRRLERARHLALQDMRSRLARAARAPGSPTAARGYRDGAARRTAPRRRRGLDDPAEIHHRDAVGDVLHHREIVRDEDVGEAEPVLQIAQQIDDLRPDRDVERRDRLVADDELRLDRERAGDGDALALAAGEFVRIAARRCAARARPGAAARRRARGGCAAARRSCRASGSARSGRRSCAD